MTNFQNSGPMTFAGYQMRCMICEGGKGMYVCDSCAAKIVAQEQEKAQEQDSQNV